MFVEMSWVFLRGGGAFVFITQTHTSPTLSANNNNTTSLTACLRRSSHASKSSTAKSRSEYLLSAGCASRTLSS